MLKQWPFINFVGCIILRKHLGQSLQDAVREIGQVVESVQTADEVMRQAERHGVELPISAKVRAALHGEITPHDGLRDLLAREQKPEYPEGLFGD